MSRDALGWRCKFAVVAPSTNTIVQPDMDDLRVEGVTNHFGRIYVPNMKVSRRRRLRGAGRGHRQDAL
jgi:maleate isomerase